MIRIAFLAAALMVAPSAMANDMANDGFGTLNPDEMTWKRFMERARDGESDMVLCATGYMLTKSGKHEAARTLFLNCAQDGYTGAMTWMSQLENNGLGGEYDPDAAAEWDRQAAELGDPVGKFNFGLDLIRGHGVARDEERGRRLVDEAADYGLDIARRLQAADYEPDAVTPDADEWKYAPMF